MTGNWEIELLQILDLETEGKGRKKLKMIKMQYVYIKLPRVYVLIICHKRVLIKNKFKKAKP